MIPLNAQEVIFFEDLLEGDYGLKILVISQNWAPENGVLQRRWTWLTSLLEGAGHEVTVIAPPPHYVRNMTPSNLFRNASFKTVVEKRSGETTETIVRTGYFPSGKSLTRKILNQGALAGAAIWVLASKPGPLKRFKPDLIIGTVPALPTAVVTYFASKRFGTPYVIDLRDAWPDLIRESDRWNSSLGNPSMREKILRHGPLQFLGLATTVAINFTLKNADGIFVTSEKLGAALRRKFPDRVGQSRSSVELIRNVFPPQVAGFQKQHREGPLTELRVLYAGTLGRAQNLANAVEAVHIARERGLDVRIRFIGAGAARQELVRSARSHKINAEFSSKIEPEDLIEHYEWADTALVHLTDWSSLEQAVPSKTSELMNIGLHISAVVSGETKELVDGLAAGHTVPPESPEQLADLWQNLAENPSQLKVPSTGAQWVREERSSVAPKALLEVVERFDRKNAQ